MKILMRLRPYGPLVLLGFNLVFGLASIWNVLRWHGKPIVGLIPFYVPISDTWVVGVPTPDWWPAISNAGMHRNDKLISIEGRSWNEHTRVIDDQVAAASTF